MNPRISIITPSFNQGKFLEETIRSVLDQNYPDLEYIIIDGGSTDDSVSIIKKYSDRLAYWVSEKDSGQSEAINKGLRRASGSIIAWLCSDDVYEPGTFSRVADFFNTHPETALVHSLSRLFGPQQKELIVGGNIRDLPLRYHAMMPFPQPSSFFRKLVLDSQGYLDESLHFAMDFDLLQRIALNYPVSHTNETWSNYRIHANSKTQNEMNGFAREWAIVFSRFVRSVNGSGPAIEVLQKAGLYHDGTSVYKHQHEFSEADIKTILSIFLHNQLALCYERLDRPKAMQILAILEKYNPVYFRENKIGSLGLKLQWLPSSVIKMLRLYTRR